ncbi:MAG TPA: hypothetical protein VKR58_05045 [Aquella sp.]|nr:hypothetical protein [Aquella sp.]
MKMRNLVNCKVAIKLNSYLLGVFIALCLCTNTAIALIQSWECEAINVDGDLSSFKSDFPLHEHIAVKIEYNVIRGEVITSFGPTNATVIEKGDLISVTGTFTGNDKITYILKKIEKNQGRKNFEPIWRLVVTKKDKNGSTSEDIGLDECTLTQHYE